MRRHSGARLRRDSKAHRSARACFGDQKYVRGRATSALANAWLVRHFVSSLGELDEDGPRQVVAHRSLVGREVQRPRDRLAARARTPSSSEAPSALRTQKARGGGGRASLGAEPSRTGREDAAWRRRRRPQGRQSAPPARGPMPARARKARPHDARHDEAPSARSRRRPRRGACGSTRARVQAPRAGGVRRMARATRAARAAVPSPGRFDESRRNRAFITAAARPLQATSRASTRRADPRSQAVRDDVPKRARRSRRIARLKRRGRFLLGATSPRSATWSGHQPHDHVVLAPALGDLGVRAPLQFMTTMRLARGKGDALRRASTRARFRRRRRAGRERRGEQKTRDGRRRRRRRRSSSTARARAPEPFSCSGVAVRRRRGARAISPSPARCRRRSRWSCEARARCSSEHRRRAAPQPCARRAVRRSRDNMRADDDVVGSRPLGVAHAASLRLRALGPDARRRGLVISRGARSARLDARAARGARGSVDATRASRQGGCARELTRARRGLSARVARALLRSQRRRTSCRRTTARTEPRRAEARRASARRRAEEPVVGREAEETRWLDGRRLHGRRADGKARPLRCGQGRRSRRRGSPLREHAVRTR